MEEAGPCEELTTIIRSDKGELHKCKEGELIFREWETANRIVILIDGIVRVEKTDANGKQKFLALASKNDILGFGALSAKQYTATAVAITDVLYYELEREHLMMIIEQHPPVSRYLFSQMESLLSYYINVSFMETYSNIETKLAQILINLAKRFGIKKENGEFEIPLKLTDAVLANLVGTNRETATRVIHRLQDQGLITKDHRIVSVLDMERMEKQYDVQNKSNIIC